MAKLFFLLKKLLKAILPSGLYERLKASYWKHTPPQMPQSVASPAPAQAFPYGVNLFIYNANNSAGMEGHLLQSALTAGNIPYQVFDLSDPEKFCSEQKGDLPYGVNLIVLHAASETPKRLQLFGIDLAKYYNIGYWAWELAEVPDAYCAGLELFQEMWTLSDFCTKTLEKKATMPVLTVPNCANPERDVIPNGREYFHFAAEPFLFMFAYDCNSFVARKNPQAVVKAFMKAFSPEDTRVGLVLKLIYPENFQQHIDELLEMLSPYKNIYYIHKYLSDTEMRTLVQSSDAFISLHRSEGLGLLPMEAMSLGTPVISTAWSGNMEYMNHMNAALVDYTMVPVDGRYAGSVPGDGLLWAEADVDAAAQLMRRMVEDKPWREHLIAHGYQTTNQDYNAKTIGAMMRNRLNVLGFHE